jgi:DNA replication protein DnaC
MTNLETLIKELELKTPASEISASDHSTLIPFLEKEKQYREQARIKRLLRQSGLKTVKTFSQFDWSFNPKLPKEEIMAFARSDWITQVANLVLIGDAGLGKSHIAKSLCYEAILKGHPIAFITTFDLISKIKKSLHPTALVDHYGRITVLCLDELGYTYHKKEDTDLIFQIISKRGEICPTLVTTNLIPKEWGSIFSGPAASAILDRLSLNGKLMTLEGKSYRLSLRKT